MSKIKSVFWFVFGFTVWIPFLQYMLSFCPYQMSLNCGSFGWEITDVAQSSFLEFDSFYASSYVFSYGLIISYVLYAMLMASLYFLVRNK